MEMVKEMYFWNIKKLKSDLRVGLNERQHFNYILLFIVLYNLGYVAEIVGRYYELNYSLTELTFVWVNLLIMLIGTILAFVINGGAKGKKFSERYFSISWVMFVRLMGLALVTGLLLIIGIIVYVNYFGAANVHKYEDTIFNIFGSTLLTYYYLRICLHIRSLSK